MLALSKKYELHESETTSYDFFLKLQRGIMDEESRNKSLGSVESELFREIMELGRRLLQEHVDQRGDGDEGEYLIRDDNKKLTHKRSSERHEETIFGRISIRRKGYGYPGESSIFPNDQQMELPEKLYSYPVQKKACREAIRSSYDEIEKTLSEYTGAHVPKRQCIGIVKDGARDFERFYEQSSGKASDSEILVISGDGKGIVMRREGLRDQTRERAQSQKMSKRQSKGEKKNRKREALVAAVYNITPHTRTVDDVMVEVNREKDSNKNKTVRPEKKRIWASVAKEKEAVYKEMLAEGLSREPSDKNVVFLCDGARSIQKPAEEILRPGFTGVCHKFVIILDLLHVIEYLWKAAYAFHKEGSREAEEWVNKYLRMILEGKAGVAAAAIKRSATRRNLRASKLKAVDKSACYIKNNKEYMRYNEYLASGFPIASGVIEGTCKHLVKDRFEISGARWGLDGAEALLKLRSVYQSGDWEEYWEFHITQEQQRIYSDKFWRSPRGTTNVSPPKLTLIRGGKESK